MSPVPPLENERSPAAESPRVADGVLYPVVPDTTPVRLRGRRLNMIGGREMRLVLEGAVRAAVRKHLPTLDEVRVRTFCATVQRTYRGLMEQNARAVRAMSRRAYLVELERSRGAMLAERDRLREELDGMRQKLVVSRTMLVEEQERFEAGAVAAAVELDRVLDAELREVLAAEGLDAEARRERIVEVTTRAVHRARQRAYDERVVEHQRRIELFERRIAKLRGSLEETETQLARLAARKPGDEGLASIYRTVQGLGDGEASAEAKRELLGEIFRANLLLRRDVAAQAAANGASAAG